MLEKHLLPLSLSLLIAIVVTFALFLGLKEWEISKTTNNNALKKQKLISVSTIIPNILMYILLAPYWSLIYFNLKQYVVFEIHSYYLSIPLALILCDFSYYCEHRIAHKSTFLWKLYHGTHHTAINYNIPVAYRVNALNFLIAPLFYLPWVILGIEPILVIGMQLFVFHYQGWVHTNLIGKLRYDKYFNTPANHRMHHSIKNNNVNFSAIFMIWDHLFHTYQKPVSCTKYGIEDRNTDDSYIGIYTDF